MKKYPSDIDSIFKAHFEDHNIVVDDRDELWQRIVQKQGRKRRGLVFIFLFAAGGLLGFQLTHQSNLKSTDTQQQVYAELATVSEDSKLSDSSSNQKENQNPVAIIEVHTEDSTEGISNTLDIKKEIPHSPSSSTVSSKESHAISTNALIDNASIDIEENPIFSESGTTELNNKEFPISKKTSSDQAALTTSKLALEKSSKKVQLSTLHTSTISLLPNNHTLEPLIPKKSPMQKCVVPSGESHFFIDIYGQVATPLERISLTSLGSDQTAYLDAWNENFSPLVSLSGGIAVGNQWSNGIGISAGVEYQRLETQYRSTQTITETTTVWDPMAFFFFDQNDEIVWVGDSVTSTTTFDRSVAHANTTELINIPIHLSYNLTQSGPWKIDASVGGIFNLSLNYEGRFLESNQTLQIVDASNQDNFISPRLGIGIEGGIDFSYFLGEKWEMYFSPRYRYNSSSYFNDSTLLNLSRDYLGLRTGLRYVF